MSDCELELERSPRSPSARARGATDAEPTVSMFVLRAMLELLEQEGIPHAEALARTGLRAEQLEQADARFSRAALDRACALALDVTGDPALGLHWAERISHRTFAPTSHMLSYVPALRQAFALLERFSPLFADERFFELDEHGDEASVRTLGLAGRSASVRRFSAELTVGGFFVMMRAVRPGLSFRRVCFSHDAPPHRAEYERVFGPRVCFRQSYTGLAFDAAALDAPLLHRDDDALRALTAVAETRMLRSTQPHSYAPRLHDLLVTRSPMRFTMGSAARALGLSERSLRRRLGEEGTSFPDVEHGALAAVARDLLQREQRTIQETAYAMGFQDISAFHRAFKRWTGATPSSYQGRPPR